MNTSIDQDLVAFVSRFGGFCRDCADEDGVCPTKGLPCDSGLRAKAIDHVVAALNHRAAIAEQQSNTAPVQ